jgi:hypothetical protein
MNDKYTIGLTGKEKQELQENIKQTNELLKKGKEQKAILLASKRPQPRTKIVKSSPYTDMLMNIYNIKNIPDAPSRKYTLLTGVPFKDQETILNRGKKAFLTSGSRRNVNSFEWSKSRLNAFVVKTKFANENELENINQDKDIFDKIRYKIK